MGLLHTEREVGKEGLTYTFASPLHRRVAYRRLLAGREPDAALKDLSLQQVCTNAIARFNPAVLKPRWHSPPNRSWGIPEAAFQDEMYCCLEHEIHFLPILSEYSHTKAGRIDFYICDRKWGIEVLQCGTNATISEHAARFATSGKYREWNIMEDYIILNFCPRDALPDIRIEGKLPSYLFL
ncbi:hypothetical protein K505DRAFT_262002 [Melanomma pulvis-pyrius CBS 109.77]|uniref:Uncharacterized protein n=1 Tax=Melanomma pulvis-pyrius CBS 109.77 TaxID=1314802 RepID=A0A6A6WN23_9PLEO|nr:hypothetical protein K505DRAFT_262002 [Melanomma pulvis-pyrius CBS 109.77]